MTSGPHQAKVLAFDVFGTVVDWHASVAREIDGMKLGVAKIFGIAPGEVMMVAAHQDDLLAARHAA
jgi:hypothetical protein